MPQLVPYFINQVTFAFIILIIMLYLFPKDILPKFVRTNIVSDNLSNLLKSIFLVMIYAISLFYFSNYTSFDYSKHYLLATTFLLSNIFTVLLLVTYKNVSPNTSLIVNIKHFFLNIRYNLSNFFFNNIEHILFNIILIFIFFCFRNIIYNVIDLNIFSLNLLGYNFIIFSLWLPGVVFSNIAIELFRVFYTKTYINFSWKRIKMLVRQTITPRNLFKLSFISTMFYLGRIHVLPIICELQVIIFFTYIIKYIFPVSYCNSPPDRNKIYMIDGQPRKIVIMPRSQQFDQYGNKIYSDEDLNLLEKDVCKTAIEKVENINTNQRINFFSIRLKIFNPAEREMIILALNEAWEKDNRFSFRKGTLALNSNDKLTRNAELAETGDLLVKTDKTPSGGAEYDSYTTCKTYQSNIYKALCIKEATYEKKNK